MFAFNIVTGNFSIVKRVAAHVQKREISDLGRTQSFGYDKHAQGLRSFGLDGRLFKAITG